MTLGAFSVILTIVVISCHHKSENEPIPKWIQILTKKCLYRIACLKKCKCSKRSKVGDSQLFERPTPLTEKKIPDMEVKEDENDELTWQILSVTLDKVFFNVYIILIALGTTVLFMLVIINY